MPGSKGKRKSNFIPVFFIILGLLFLGFVIRTDYVLVKPGTAQDLREMVTVEGADRDDRGKFFLVTVAQQQASLWSLLYGYLHPYIEVQRLSNVIPPGMQEQEYHELLEQWMQESKNTAQVIALRRAGYNVEIISEGVVVAGFLENSPSRGILSKGDLITAVDGENTLLAGEVISAVQQRQVGDPVRLTVLRDSEKLELTVITVPHPDDPKLPALGVFISTLSWEPVLPIDVELATGEIAGPSAGLMFVLEILNQLQPGDLTSGHLIAGTGTIDINENVGPIGGVFQKVIAAERAEASYFLVPVENYEEAKTAVHQIELIPVKTLQEALDFLDSLAAAGGSSFQLDHGHEGRFVPAA
ncbi:MAG: PDZ domain-containing protein [Dethiobacteria bacterium]